jgi:hypothetical protein
MHCDSAEKETHERVLCMCVEVNEITLEIERRKVNRQEWRMKDITVSVMDRASNHLASFESHF